MGFNSGFKGLTSFQTSSKTEGTGLRLIAWNGLHPEAVGVSEVAIVCLPEHTVEKLYVATFRCIRNSDFSQPNVAELCSLSVSRLSTSSRNRLIGTFFQQLYPLLQ